MNRKYLYLLIIAFLGNSCQKDLPSYVSYESYSYSTVDEKGGTWKPLLLGSTEQISVATPTDVNSNEYKTELNDLFNKTQSLTSDQQSKIDYWTNNSIIRWNEIARELAAKYNLTPAPNADGTYPAPDATNPSKYPLFPFAHPPYASRALAYLSVAQFDAMLTVWNNKFKYNRPSPSKSNASIKSAFPDSGLPSYPSDAATIAAVSRDILTAMFPLEKDYLAQKADELKNVLQWAGQNVKSDIDEGEKIGAAIAKLALSRASTDGMKQAQVNKTVSDSIAKAASDKFGWKWVNMESPQRPVGIAPNFGRVKLWNVPSVEVVRPVEPPKIGSTEFNTAAEELKSIAKNITTEQRKIANWWSDGLGTYTPPGHWNRFACDYLVKYKLNPLRSARVLAYMNMAIMDAGISCWDAKYFYFYPRPINVIPDFKTILGTPNFPSYTSGHSTFSAAAAEVLSYFFPNEKEQCDKWAKEASESRIYGGIHFRFDCERGLEQGKKVGIYSVEIAKKDGGG